MDSFLEVSGSVGGLVELVAVLIAITGGRPMGYVEQLYTFIDADRKNEQGLPVLYVSYLGLVREADETTLSGTARWCD